MIPSGICSDIGTQTLTQDCIPNPNTGLGCLDNGQQTFASKVSIVNCSGVCNNTNMSVTENDYCNILDVNTGLNVTLNQSCFTGQENIVYYRQKTYTCNQAATTGDSGCTYTCGSDNTIKNNIMQIETNYNNIYPSVNGFAFCYDSSGIDQLLPLKTSAECTLETCTNFNSLLPQNVNANNFIFPTVCYTKDPWISQPTIINFNSNNFLSPYIIRDGFQIPACFNDQNLPVPNGTIINLNIGDSLVVNEVCPSNLVNKLGICGNWLVQNNIDAECPLLTNPIPNFSSNQVCTQSTNQPSTIISEICYIPTTGMNYWFTSGFINSDYMICSTDLCEIPTSATLYNSIVTYNEGDQVYIDNIITAFFSASSANTGINPLTDGNYSVWVPISNPGVPVNSWVSTSNYSPEDIVSITYVAFIYLESTIDNNTNNPNITTTGWTQLPYVNTEIQNPNEWSPTTYYYPNTDFFAKSLISYGKYFYICIAQNVNTPPPNPLYWNQYIPEEIYVPKENRYITIQNLSQAFSVTKNNPYGYPIVITDSTGVQCLETCAYYNSTDVCPISYYFCDTNTLNGSYLSIIVFNNYILSLNNTLCSAGKSGQNPIPSSLTQFSDCGGKTYDNLYSQALSFIFNPSSSLNFPSNCYTTDTQSLTNFDYIQTSNSLLLFVIPQSFDYFKILAIFGVSYKGFIKCNFNLSMNQDTNFNVSSGSIPLAYFSPENFNTLSSQDSGSVLIPNYSNDVYVSSPTDVISDLFSIHSGNLFVVNNNNFYEFGVVSYINSQNCINVSLNGISLSAVYPASNFFTTDLTLLQPIINNRENSTYQDTCSLFFNYNPLIQQSVYC
jgi:hypothetical protein